jgi:hypothetical protein
MDQFHSTVLQDTKRWLDRAVIGLNLCPFAKAVHVRGLIHFAVCDSSEMASMLADLDKEMVDLYAMKPDTRETTLWIVPTGLQDFADMLVFTRHAERLLRRRRLVGVLQIASFHPGFQFAGTGADDIENFTNRSPYPTLHLLREESVELAVAVFPDPKAIYGANVARLRAMGDAGWEALEVGASRGK